MRRLAFLLLLLTWCAPLPAVAQSADVITGRVVGPDGLPLGDVQIEAISIETEISRSVLTNANGRYTIVFPDGGGRYLLRVSYVGTADIVRTLVREQEEDLLIADFDLSAQAIELEAIQVRAQLPAPGRGAAGEQRTIVGLELLKRLSLPDLDAETLAQLVAGVVATEGDTLSGRRGFSVGGMSDQLNQVRLDGAIIGEGAGGFAAPEEGVRRVQVTTGTFDVARGGFAGGQISMTTARGTNRAAGSLSYTLNDAALQVRTTPSTNPATRHNAGGSWGGPIVANRLFYNASFQAIRNIEHRYALATHDPLAAQRSGVSSDSIARFVSILRETYGFATAGQTGAYNQLGNDLRLQARIDWNVQQRPERAHTLSVRGNLNLNRQDSTRINVLDVSHHGGDTERNNRLAGASLTSRFGQKWTNTLNASYAETTNDAVPYIEMPEGLVRVTSQFDDGTRGTRSIVFGGNRNMPTAAYNRDVQLANEVSFLLPIGAAQMHRFKIGGSVQRLRDVTRSTDNLFGSFTYASLADFEENRADRYERSLSARETRTGRLLAGVYIGDSWRVTAPLEVTLGVRWDYSRFDQRPAYNPAVEEVFDRRTDEMPVVGAFSPRFGFTYRLTPQQRGVRLKSLSGGIGLFAGRTPTNIFSAALRQTGLPDAEQRLVCIGNSVPFADWDLFIAQPGTVPTTCADGAPGASTQSSRAPTITVIAPRQTLPTSLRAEIGYRGPLPWNVDGTVRYTYSRGYGLWGYRDLNLDDSRVSTLGHEARPFFGDSLAIVQRTGAVSFVTSRVDRGFGSVYEVRSDRRSESHQVAFQANGRVRPPTQVSANYTIGFTRDNGSGAFTAVPTAGNPNAREWARAGTDRTHTLNLVLTHALTQHVELSATARLSSGLPFTPIVNRDINGDGSRNDRAFVFDPATAVDTGIAHGMERMRQQLPGRVQACLDAQKNRIAERNSCRESWTQGFDMRANIRPSLPRLQRRMTMSLDVRNVLTGLDAALHGRANAKGWGEGQRAENILLNVRGFSRESNSFRYEVNEAFGQARRGPSAGRNAFTATIAARVSIGGQPGTANRGFAQFGGGAGSGSTGAAASFYGPFTPLLRTMNPTTNVDSVFAAAFTNPLRRVLELADTLSLSAEQREAVVELAAALDVAFDARRASLRPVIDSLLVLRRQTSQRAPSGQTPPGQTQSGQTQPGQSGQTQGGQTRATQADSAQRGTAQGTQGTQGTQGAQGTQGGQAGRSGPPTTGGQGGGQQPSPLVRHYQAEGRPQVDGARQDVAAALRALEQVLSAEQWHALPREVREAGAEGGPQRGQGGRTGG
jgi:hypothetical protein